MHPISFSHANTVFAEDQPEYIPLPAYRGEDGQVITCWQMTLTERFLALFTGKIWLHILTFHQPLQPVMLETSSPFVDTTTQEE